MSRIYLPVATNGSGNVKANYMLSLVAAVSGSGLEIELARADDSLAQRAMNKVAADFLASTCDELLIVDCDIEVTARHLKWLFEHDVPLVYGPYFKRQPKAELCLASLHDGDRADPEKVLWEVRRAGRGFTRVHRSVFERMKEDNGGPALRYHNHGRVEWHFWPAGVVEGSMSIQSGTDDDGFPRREYLSEDWWFDEYCRSIGIPVLVDTRIMARHEGDQIYPIPFDLDVLPGILARFTAEEIVDAAESVGMTILTQEEIGG